MRFGNGYGGIVKNGGKRRRPWQVRITKGYTDEGRQIYETLGFFEKKEEAISCLAEYNAKPYDIKAKERCYVCELSHPHLPLSPRSRRGQRIYRSRDKCRDKGARYGRPLPVDIR